MAALGSEQQAPAKVKAEGIKSRLETNGTPGGPPVQASVPIRLMQTPTICSVIQTNYGFTEL
jgi:hypothetical protein